MGEAAWPAAVAVATGLLACLMTRLLIPILARREILDRPNERSSHRLPTPRGGGIAVIGAVLLGWIALARTGSAPSSNAGPAIVLARKEPGMKLAARALPLISLLLLALGAPTAAQNPAPEWKFVVGGD